MSFTTKKVQSALEKISKEFKIPLEDIHECIGDIIPPPSPWASAKAKELGLKTKVNPYKVKATGKGGKITLNDLRSFLGEENPKKPSAFASKQAKDLAKENDLSEDDFSDDERTGNPRKSGEITITLNDVRNKLGIKVEKKPKSPFASPKTKQFAEENDIDPTKIEGSGKDGRITKKDIETYMKTLEEEDEEEESEENDEDESK